MRLLVRAVAVALGCALFAWLAIVGLILYDGSRPEIHRADAILVLGAAQYNGHPSPVLRARLDHALLLYREGLAAHLVVTGGVGRGDTVSEGEVARRYAVAHGVPDSVILVDRRGRTSAESVEAAAELMRERRLTSALVVSDAFHMLRLEVLTRLAGIQPYRAPAPESPIARNRLLRLRYLLRESALVPVALATGPVRIPRSDGRSRDTDSL